jgi:hypothetical protein
VLPRRTAPEPTLDHDALAALAWIESGMPDDKVGHGPDAPKLTAEQLQQFAPASYVTTPKIHEPLHPTKKRSR